MRASGEELEVIMAEVVEVDHKINILEVLKALLPLLIRFLLLVLLLLQFHLQLALL